MKFDTKMDVGQQVMVHAVVVQSRTLCGLTDYLIELKGGSEGSSMGRLWAGQAALSAVVAPAQPAGKLREALEALADKMEERCGDHCSNSCKVCEYRNDLRLILVRTAALGRKGE